MNVQGINNNNIAQALREPQNEPNQEPVKDILHYNNAAPQIPENDEYIPEKPTVGIYNVMNDENGNPKLQFNEPNSNAKPDSSKAEPMDKSQKADGSKNRQTEKTTANTDKVDREIKRLKQKKAQLEKQIQSSDDPNKINELKKKLAQVKNELQQKDNDSYRRRSTTFN